MKKFLIHFFLFIAIFLIAVSAISPLVFFVSDVGLRYLQIQYLIAHNWQTFAIDYPAMLIDPDFEFVPFYYAYSIIHNQIFLNISPYLPFFSSFLYKIMGVAGLAVIPVLGAVFTGWAIKKLVQLHNLPFPDLMLWLTILVTPLLFYSLQIWDHTIAVAFSTWAVYFAARGIKHTQPRDALWAGVLLGLGLGQRPELHAFALALAVGIWVASRAKFRDIANYFIGGVIGVIPIWITQYLWFGHPLGVTLGRQFFGYGEPKNNLFDPLYRLELPRYTKIGLLLYDIDQSQPVLNVLILLFLCVGFLLIVLGFIRKQKLAMVYVGLSLFTLGYIVSILVYWGKPIQGLLSTFPLIPLSLILIRQKDVDDPQVWRGYQLIGVTSLIFFALILLIWPADGGLQWGSRYLLPLYPLLFYMAIFTYHQLCQAFTGRWKGALQITAVTLLGISIAIEIMGVNALLVSHDTKMSVRDTIDNLPVEYILTNAPYLRSNLITNEKTFLYVDNSEILSKALDRLALQGAYDFAVIPLAQIELPVPERISQYRVEKVSDWVYHLSREQGVPHP